MVPSGQPQPAMGDVAGGSQVHTAAATVGIAPASSQPTPPFPATPAQLSAQDKPMYEQLQEYQQQLQQQQQRQLKQFWAEQRSELEQATDMKNHLLPLTRIRKIMKADEDVHMISPEAPALFAKACEMFTLEMTMRSWMVTKENKRRVLQRSDVAAAVARTDIYDFLLDLFTRDETKEGVLLPRTGHGQQHMGAPAGAYPYYHAPQQQVAGASMAYGGPSTYVWQEPQVQEQGHPSSTYVWQEPQQQQEGP